MIRLLIVEILRLLYISGRSDYSGGPIMMKRLVQRLDKSSFKVWIALPKEDQGIDQELAQDFEIIDIQSRSFSLSDLFTLIRCVKRNKIEVIHSHGKAAGFLSRVLGVVCGVPVVHHLHGIHYQQYSILFRFIYLKVESLLSALSSKVICVSESEQNDGVDMGVFLKEKSLVIPNGIDISHFRPQHIRTLRDDLKLSQDAFILASISRYCYQKNIDASLEIIAKLKDSGCNAYLLLIGVSPVDAQLQKRMAELKITNQVICPPQVNDTRDLLNQADIYLSTSRWEGMSLGLLEAMACGLPSVISNVVGNMDLLPFQNEGTFCVDQHSIPAYLEVIKKLALDTKYRQEMGQAARQQVTDHYNLAHSIQSIENLYLSLGLRD